MIFWPIFIRVGMTFGLAPSIDLALTPYFFPMVQKLSPLAMTCSVPVEAIGAGVSGGAGNPGLSLIHI